MFSRQSAGCFVLSASLSAAFSNRPGLLYNKKQREDSGDKHAGPKVMQDTGSDPAGFDDSGNTRNGLGKTGCGYADRLPG